MLSPSDATLIQNLKFNLEISGQKNQEQQVSVVSYSHLSNNRGGWNKRGGWDFLEKTST